MSTTGERPEVARAAALAAWLREQPIARRICNTLLRDLQRVAGENTAEDQPARLHGLDREEFVNQLHQPDGGAIGAIPGIGAKTLAALRQALPAPQRSPAPNVDQQESAKPVEKSAMPAPAGPPAAASETAAPANNTLGALVAAAEGLLVPSESEYPFVPFRWLGDVPPTSAALLAELELAPDTPVETRSPEQFFAPLARVADWMDERERAQAERFAALRDLVLAQLTNVEVYRLGQRKIAVIIAGQDAAGATVGLRTTLIET